MTILYYASIQADNEFRDYGPQASLVALQHELGKEIDAGELTLYEWQDEVRVIEINSETRRMTSYNMIQGDIPVSETDDEEEEDMDEEEPMTVRSFIFAMGSLK
jgi:hypothetical protein